MPPLQVASACALLVVEIKNRNRWELKLFVLGLPSLGAFAQREEERGQLTEAQPLKQKRERVGPVAAKPITGPRRLVF